MTNIEELDEVVVESYERTLFHESGHVVVGFIVGAVLENLDLIARVEWKILHVTYYNTETKCEDSVQDVLCKILITMAGKQIEIIKFVKPFEEGLISDYEALDKLNKSLTNLNNVEEVLNICKIVCNKIINDYYEDIKLVVEILQANKYLYKTDLEKIMKRKMDVNGIDEKAKYIEEIMNIIK